MKLPKDPHDRTLTEKETEELVKKGWVPGDHSSCNVCRSKGCESCHYTGITLLLWKGKDYYLGVPYGFGDSVGGLLRAAFMNNATLGIRVSGLGGTSEVEIPLPAAWKLMKMIVDATADHTDPRHLGSIELGVKFKVSGPPAMYIAGSKPKNQSNRRPTKNQLKAIGLLMEADLYEEAGLLRQACGHECFLVNRKEEKHKKESLGKLKPGVIFERKGNTAVIRDGGKTTVVELDEDESVLSII